MKPATLLGIALLAGAACSSTDQNGTAGDSVSPGDHDASNHGDDNTGRGDTAGPGDAGGGDSSGCNAGHGTPFVPCPNTGFTPDSATEDWRHPYATGLVVLEGAANHRGYDTIVNPGQEQLLIGKFAYGRFDDDLKDENVEIWLQATCGSWQKLGSALTSEEGEYGTVNGITDDGGRVFFTIPEGSRLGLGSYRVKMLVKGDHSEANFWLLVWPAGVHVVVSDIDGTITTQENDGAWSILDPTSPAVRPAAVTTFSAYAAKGYRLIFLTARPDFLENGTEAWFASHGLPAGAFHLSPNDFGEIGGTASDYKAGYLTSIITGAGVVVDWAYGNKDTDLAAYLTAGITPSHVNLIEGEYTGDLMGATMLPGYEAEPARVGCLPPVNLP